MKILILFGFIFTHSIHAGLTESDRTVKIADFRFVEASFNRSLKAISSIRKERGNVPVYYNKLGCMIYGDWSDMDASIMSARNHRIELARKEALTGKAFVLIKLIPETVDEKSNALPTNIKYITCTIDPKEATVGDLESRLDGIISFE